MANRAYTSDFDYALPPGRIATHPCPERDGSRLYILDRTTEARQHAFFRDLPTVLAPRSLLVLNQTRVIPARLRGKKTSGGAVEVLLVRPLRASPADHESFDEDWEVLARGAGGMPQGTALRFGDALHAEILEHGLRGSARMRFVGRGARTLLEAAEHIGELPLPPYIETARKHEAAAIGTDDRDRYQTVFAREPGAVAAPTAGLHFTPRLLADVQGAGHEIAAITLHVGPGTFRPVETDDPTEHVLDTERYEVSAQAAMAINQARAERRPIVAVGTTVVRTLESAFDSGAVRAGSGETSLMVLPGFTFRVVTDLVTNFHLPRSTLLMLVAALAGKERILAAYADAIESGYRFYSYGDAMFIRNGIQP